MEKRMERGEEEEKMLSDGTWVHTHAIRSLLEPRLSLLGAADERFEAHTHTQCSTVEKKKRGAREDKSNPLEGLYIQKENGIVDS